MFNESKVEFESAFSLQILLLLSTPLPVGSIFGDFIMDHARKTVYFFRFSQIQLAAEYPGTLLLNIGWK